MSEKDQKNKIKDEEAQQNDEFEQLSQDEKAAFEKIMNEISQINEDTPSSEERNTEQPESSSSESDDESNTDPESSSPEPGDGAQPMDETSNPIASDDSDDEELTGEQQAALDKIMADIGGEEQTATNEKQETAPQDSDDEELTGEQQAALDKIMADIGGEEQVATNEKQETAPQDSDDEELTGEQQAALDKIMADIGKKKDSENDQPQETPSNVTRDDDLTDEQQTALDKIMADIGKGNSAEADPTAQEAPAEGREDPGQENLSLDEFNDELTDLLSSVDSDDNAPEESTQSSASNSQPESEEEELHPAPPEAMQTADVSSEEIVPEKEPEPETPEASESVSEEPLRDYPILHEIDPEGTASTVPKNEIKKGFFNFLPFKNRGMRIMSLCALIITVLVGAAYWRYDSMIAKWPAIRAILNSPPPVAETEPVLPVAEAPEPPKSTDPVQTESVQTQPEIDPPEEVNPFTALKDELAAARQYVRSKMDEIQGLKFYYTKGIEEERKKIENEIADPGLRSVKDAVKESQVDLGLRAIQRRMMYIGKLGTPLKRLELSAEELLYFERRAQIYEILNNRISGVGYSEFKQEVNAVIESHLRSSNELSVDQANVTPPTMASIWQGLRADRKKRTPPAASSSVQYSAHDRTISKEICQGDFKRTYMLTSLSSKTAQCLVQWPGKDLFLNEIAELPPAVAKILAQWPGEWLSLNGIQEIPVESAHYLSKWPGKRLSLNGLTRLSPKATAYLSEWQGEQLEMVGLTSIGRWENYSTRLYLSEALKRKLQVD